MRVRELACNSILPDPASDPPPGEALDRPEASAARSAGTRVAVAVDAPQYSGLDAPLDYLAAGPLTPGTLVRVPLGRREVLGVVWPQRGPAAPEAASRARSRDTRRPSRSAPRPRSSGGSTASASSPGLRR